MKRTVNSFILGIIGLIFVFDTYAYIAHNDTISEQITAWLDASTTNLVIFLAGVLLICVHWIFGKYKD